MNLKQFFSSQYLFQINTAYVNPQEKLFLLGGGILVLLAIALRIAAALAPNTVDAKYRFKFYKVFLTVGLGELFWYLCRYENIRFFGSHFVAWLWVLIGFLWLVRALVLTFKNYGKEKLAWSKEELRQRYLPR